MAQYYDRYNQFRIDGDMKPIPGLTLPIGSSDKVILYRQGETRLDKLSNKYYNNPYSGWLIMLANPQFGGLEFNIPNETYLRLPYPFDSGILRYIS